LKATFGSIVKSFLFKRSSLILQEESAIPVFFEDVSSCFIPVSQDIGIKPLLVILAMIFVIQTIRTIILILVVTLNVNPVSYVSQNVYFFFVNSVFLSSYDSYEQGRKYGKFKE
jgi:hypothetical protein